MRFFTKEWYQKIQQPNDQSDFSPWTHYELHLKKLCIPEQLRAFSAHDCWIEQCEWVGKDLRMSFDTVGALTDIKQVVFREAALSCEESELIGGCWLYEEIERCDDKWRLSVLLDWNNALFEIAICFLDLEVK